MRLTITKPRKASYVFDHRLSLEEAKSTAMDFLNAVKAHFEPVSKYPLEIEADYHIKHAENFGKLNAFYLVEIPSRSRVVARLNPKKRKHILLAVSFIAYGNSAVNGIECTLYHREIAATVIEILERYAHENELHVHAGHIVLT